MITGLTVVGPIGGAPPTGNRLPFDPSDNRTIGHSTKRLQIAPKIPRRAEETLSPARIVCSLPRCRNHSFHESFHIEYIPPLRRLEIKGNGVIHGKSDSCIWGVNILLSQG